MRNPAPCRPEEDGPQFLNQWDHYRPFDRGARRSYRRTVHSEDTGRRACIRPRLRYRRRYCRCDLWQHRGIRPYVCFKLSGGSTGMASINRWHISLLFGHCDLSEEICRTNGQFQSLWTRRSLLLDVFPDPHQPDDDHLFYGHIRRLGVGECERKLSLCGSLGDGDLFGLKSVVAHLEQRSRRIPHEVGVSPFAVAQQTVGVDHTGIWSLFSA